MDEDGSSTSVPTASNYNRLPSESIFTDTLPIFVENEWGVAQPRDRLASSSSEVDQGIPELLLSLVATGTHSFNFENSEKLIKGFSKIITRCGFWAITSGEQNDPLAAAVAAALRCTLPQQRDSGEETLVIAVNSMDVAYQAALHHAKTPIMTDSRYNTFYMVSSVCKKTARGENTRGLQILMVRLLNTSWGLRVCARL
uniref:Uncharacterized protein n=1 Tax=Ditylenchus dipsaci TaxID=166011 RepID=A0A915CWZ7_9BILA